ncbi:hypothetical protein [Caproiciproducens sp. MSJ-32]|uniref:hypothetical protein n=1 Tax=Caproiciproducens sp. MSJ-32 TaxID=2841527 RepID=UPI001C11A7E3|nr:hypothetical protein [Caproiciproducens sp. MSJ-32]MBU5454340.1 hypothetical protein [Caproiciproducens sp. MSJ-32]
MSKEMNNLFKIMIKYDLIGGFFLTTILSIVVNIKFSIIFLFGDLVSLINAVSSGILLEYALKKGKGVFLFITYIIRILIIVILAIPFLNNLMEIIAYILGYMLHFIFQVIYWINVRKEES